MALENVSRRFIAAASGCPAEIFSRFACLSGRRCTFASISCACMCVCICVFALPMEIALFWEGAHSRGALPAVAVWTTVKSVHHLGQEVTQLFVQSTAPTRTPSLTLFVVVYGIPRFDDGAHLVGPQQLRPVPPFLPDLTESARASLTPTFVPREGREPRPRCCRRQAR